MSSTSPMKVFLTLMRVLIAELRAWFTKPYSNADFSAMYHRHHFLDTKATIKMLLSYSITIGYTGPPVV